MSVKATAIKPGAATASSPAKTGNAKSIQRKTTVAQTLPVVQRKENAGSWLHTQPQKAASAKPLIQPKVKIHAANDHFEKEADHVADKVVNNQSASSTKITATSGSSTQRKPNENYSTRIQTRINNLGSPETLHGGDNSPPMPDIHTEHPLTAVLSNKTARGSPLPASARRQMETSMGASFNNVRIHTGQESHNANTSIGARAFTHGDNIYFANGQFNPNTKSGQHLLAHELTHTIQQGASARTQGSVAILQRSAYNASSFNTITPVNDNRGPPVQTKSSEAIIQCSLVDTAVSRVGELLNDLPPFTEGIEGAKQWLMQKARRFASFIPGYAALGVVMGQDPITGEHIERNGRNFINAALDIIPGGSLLKQKLEELGAIDRAAAWIDQQLETLSGIVANIRNEFVTEWNRLELPSILTSPVNALRSLGDIFERGINNLISFAERTASELLSIVKQFLLTQIVDFIKNHTTAYELLKVIIGHDPVTEERVERNGTNILNALLELGGEQGREQRRQMQDTGTFQKAADWIDRGITVFGNLYETIRANFGLIWDAVSIESLMHPVDTFNRLYEKFAEPIMQVLNFVAEALEAILGLIKEVLLQRLSAWATTVKGYALVTVLIGKDPFTNAVVPRTVPNIIHGFMSLMDGGEEQYQQMVQSGAIARTTQRIEAAVAGLNMTPATVLQLFIGLWNSFSFNDLAHPIDAFQRIINRFGEPIAKLIAFIIEIVKIVIHVILEIMNFPFDLINNIINRAMAAFERIKRDPVGFLKNLLRAIKQGFIQFFDHIGTHLLNGVIGWLMSELKDANVPELKDFSLRGVISWVLQVLNLSMETIWQKLAAHPRIGPERVARIRGMINTLEGIWTFIKDVQQRGMAAIWDKIQEQLSNLWNTILTSVKNWIMEKIVGAVTTKLLSMLDPTGIMAVINSAIAIYRAVQSFIKYLRQMLEIVNSFVNGVADIAEGNITTAANYLERTMASAMPIVIGFLANQVGLSGIGKRIGEMITSARQLVDRALTWLVNKAVDTGFAVIDRLMSMGREAVGGGGTPQQRLDNALNDAQTAVNRFAGTKVGNTILNPLLYVIKLKYGLQSLEVVPEGNVWAVEGSINPRGRRTTTAQVASGTASNEQAILESIISNRQAPDFSSSDTLGRAKRVSGYVQGVKPTDSRSGISNITLKGYLPLDQRGHLIADRFYGPGVNNNLVPMHPTLNNVTYKRYETQMADAYNALKNQNKGVLLSITAEPVYPGNDANNPAHYRPTNVSITGEIKKIKPNSNPPEAESNPPISSGLLLNEIGTTGAININSASEQALIDTFGANLGRIIFNERKNGIYGDAINLQQRIMLVAGTDLRIERLNERLLASGHLILFGSRTQPKLKNNTSTNHHEREADHVADKVVSKKKATPSTITKIDIKQQITSIQNKQQSHAATSVVTKPDTRGSPLPASTKKQMEKHIGADFSHVRIHTNNESHKANEAIGSRAFTQGANIHFAKGEFKPDTKEGRHLLAHELTHTVQQGASPHKEAGATFKEEKPTTHAPPVKKGAASLHTKTKEHIEPADAGATAKPTGAKAKKRSPSTPEEDPAFQQTVHKGQARTHEQRSHSSHLSKAGDAQAAATAVPNEAESKAQNRKADTMNEAGKNEKLFDAASFKKDLLNRINEITPKTLEEADDFKEHNRIGEVKGAMNEKVTAEKQTTVGPVTQATSEPLHTNDSDKKQAVTLPSTDAGSNPASIGAQNAAPKPKTDDEISMQDQSASLDDEMKQNNVTEDQLQHSNEPSFQSAVKEKKNAQKDAVEKPMLYKKAEAAELKTAQNEAASNAAVSMNGMHKDRNTNFMAVVLQQNDSKKKDEDARAKVAQDINDKYAATEKTVTDLLSQAETESNSIFENGAEAARQIFEDYTDEKMSAYKADRYGGVLGGGYWLKDKLMDLPDEVNVFYVDGKNLYIDKMDKVLTRVSTVIADKLNAAKKAIDEGKQKIDEYVGGLPDSLKSVGTEAADAIKDKFDSLEQTVKDKGHQLIEGLAKKYVDNVKKLDDRINELKEANKSLISKAIGLLKAVWKVIKNIYELFKTILSKLAQIVGTILGAPGKFFSNLGAAFSKGFDMFKSRLGEHLENGLMAWLSDQLGVADIKLPDKFDIASIFSLVLQVMGISYAHIRERAVEQIGEERVALMETTVGIFQRIFKEGLGAIWEMIKEKFTDFKEMIWEAIKTFIRDSVIKAALEFLLSLLSPIGAFIKACMAIYDFLMMLVRMKDKIIEMLNSILDAVISIASGSIDGAAAAIEKALAKSIPILIGFLASLLHLNDLGAKVRDIILRIRAKVDKVIDWLIDKAYKLVGPVVETALRIKNKGKELVEKGKEKAIGLGKAAVAKFASFLGIKQEFKATNGESHELYFEGSSEEASEMWIASRNPMRYSDFLQNINTNADKRKTVKKAEAIEKLKEVQSAKRQPIDTSVPEEDARTKKYDLVNKKVIELSVPTSYLFGGPLLPLEFEFDGLNDAGFAKGMTIRNLNKNNRPPVGGAPSISNEFYEKLDNRRNGGTTYYIKGHLLNGYLGGTGSDFRNLTPLSRTGNGNHEREVESKIINEVDAGKTVEYIVKPVYGSKHLLSDKQVDNLSFGVAKTKKIKEAIMAENFAPTGLKCTAKSLNESTGNYDEKIVSITVENPIDEKGPDYEV